MVANESAENKALILDLTGKKKRINVYSLLSPLAVIILAIVVVYLCNYMITDPSPISKLSGIFLAVMFTSYILYYLIRFYQSRDHQTFKIVLDDRSLEVTSASEVKKVSLNEIIFSMSYSSATNLCIIVATEKDYITMNCSCSYFFTKSGESVLSPFYSINKYFMELNHNHVNYIKNSRNKKDNPFIVPHFLFEVEFYTKRVKKFLANICPKYRFQ